MTGQAPRVSVIMSVYNGARDAPAAVRSILNQTFRDFELIAIDNGSSKDDSRAVIEALAQDDPRCRVVPLETNIGLAGALNCGIGLARGRYIARQDHDDISHPTRLDQQVQFLDAHPRCGLVGTRAEIWVGDEPTGRNHDHPTDNAELQTDLMINNPFVHSSIMLRRELLETVGAYTRDPARQPPEDFELWSRIARRCEVANLPERLVVYREVAQSMSRDAANPFLDRLLLISSENIAFWSGLKEPERHSRAAAALLHAAYSRVLPDTDIEAVVRTLDRAVDAIEAGNPGSDLSARKAMLRANARHHYAHACQLPEWAKPLVPIARRLSLSAAVKEWLAARVAH
jgi:glycosyltransferase involved in cell wall biosynthesis